MPIKIPAANPHFKNQQIIKMTKQETNEAEDTEEELFSDEGAKPEEVSQEEKNDEGSVEEGIPAEENIKAEEAGLEKKKEIIEPEESHVFKQVSSIVFSVLSPKIIKDMASAKIITP